MRIRGFTLVECLIGLALSFIVVTAGLGSYLRIQRDFLRLEEREVSGQAALAAVDRMRIDLLHAGFGLVEESRLGIVEPVLATETELRTASLERTLAPAVEPGAGDTRLILVSTAGVAVGRSISLRSGTGGEVRTVVRIEGTAVVLDSPLTASYPSAYLTLSLLEIVAYYVDGRPGILRRRVNASAAQPLLEDVAAAAWSHDTETGLVRIRIDLAVEGAHPHGTTVFLKNAALARSN